MYQERLKIIREELAAAKVDAVVLTASPVVRWATGLESSNALVYADASRALVVTDGRYQAAARQTVKHAEVIIGVQQDLAVALAPQLPKPPARLGFQADRTLVNERDSLQAAFPKSELVGLDGFLQVPIARKSPEELDCVARAQAVTDVVFTEILPLLKPGISEAEVAAELVYRQLRHGATGISPEFWPIVAFGERSALPHAHATNRTLRANEAVLLDFGCTVNGYCSDMTRTVFVGKPPAKFREVYELVLRAQTTALQKVRAGLPANEVDAGARDLIAAAGYELPHGLGHSLGLEIHEWPALNPRTAAKLPAGALVTVEPGVYLPGEFGIRIEDLVVLEADGCHNLTTSPKELITL